MAESPSTRLHFAQLERELDDAGLRLRILGALEEQLENPTFTVDSCEVIRDAKGRSRGFGFAALRGLTTQYAAREGKSERDESIDVDSSGDLTETSAILETLRAAGLSASVAKERSAPRPSRPKADSSGNSCSGGGEEAGKADATPKVESSSARKRRLRRERKAALAEQVRTETTFLSPRLSLLAKWEGYDNYHDSWTHSSPCAIAIHPETGAAIVADSGCHSLYLLDFTTAGGLERQRLLAGLPEYDGWGNDDSETGGAARFHSPTDLAICAAHDRLQLLVADHSGFRIRSLDLKSTAVTTLVQSNNIFVTGVTTVTTDTGNTLMFSSEHSFHPVEFDAVRVRTLTPSGLGESVPGPSFLQAPRAMTTDAQGNVLVIDGHCIMKLWQRRNWEVTILAGSRDQFGSEDGAGEWARFCHPSNLCLDLDGSVLVADTKNDAIRRIIVTIDGDGHNVEDEVTVLTVFDDWKKERGQGQLRAVATHADGSYLICAGSKVLRLEREERSEVKSARKR
jgi:hypothetical protein